MLEPKIIVDTNVVVAASILQNISELHTTIKHEFYDQSIQLFSLFKKHNDKKIGYAVPKVKLEAFSVLTKAVKDVFVPSSLTDTKRKELFYDDAIAIINSSEHKMRSLFHQLSLAKINEQDIKTNLKQVKQMSSYLINIWKTQYNKRGWRTKESKTRSKPIINEPRWKPEQKQEVVSTHKEQVNRESRQLYRFSRKHPNHQDERILAETITLKKYYEEKGESYMFMIASCDSGFFSPHIGRDGISDTVTQEIKRRFNIECDYPRHVFFKCGGI